MKVLVLAIATVFFSLTATAQKDRPQQPSPEKMAEQQAARIARQLAFDDATTSKFITTFGNYQKELRELRKNSKAERRMTDSLCTDAEAEQALKASFKYQQDVLDLKLKYYDKYYSKFLSAKQVAQVYMLEKSGRKDGRQFPCKRDPQGCNAQCPGQRDRQAPSFNGQERPDAPHFPAGRAKANGKDTPEKDS